MKTETGFIIGFSKSSKQNFCWFVRHSQINKGTPIPVERGNLEATLNKLKQNIVKEKTK